MPPRPESTHIVMSRPEDAPFESNDLPAEGPAKAGGPAPRRSHSFSPDPHGPAAPQLAFKQVVSPQLIKREAWEDIEAAPDRPLGNRWQESGQGPGGELLPDRRTGTVEHKLVESANVIHEWSDPNKLEHRAKKWLVVLGWGVLASVVGYALISTVLFSAAPEGSAESGVPPAAKKAAGVPAAAAGVEIDEQAAAVAGLRTLARFLEAKTPEERATLLPPEELVAPRSPLARQTPLGRAADLQADQARVVRMGDRPAVLVPVVDAAGLTRIAAVLQNDAGRWLVDWRSVLTPERLSWSEFPQDTSGEPALFRLQLTPAETEPTALTASLPSGATPPLRVELPPGARVARELAALWAAAPADRDRTIEAEVYLQHTADGRVAVVGYVPERWRLP